MPAYTIIHYFKHKIPFKKILKYFCNRHFLFLFMDFIMRKFFFVHHNSGCLEVFSLKSYPRDNIYKIY